MTKTLDSAALDLAPLLARRELWLLVSAASVDPYHGERLNLLNDPRFRQRCRSAAALLSEEFPAVELGPGEASPAAAWPPRLFAAFDAGAVKLETDYRRLFGLTSVSPACPPCELEYEPNTDVAYRSQRLADVAGFYKAFGFELAPHAGERFDHVSVQAEFLYLLLAKEAAAQQAGHQEGAAVCRAARRKFFEEHVGWWLPAFARLLARAALCDFYRELAALMAALAAAERTSLGLPAFQARVVPKPSEAEVAAGCGPCSSGQDGVL